MASRRSGHRHNRRGFSGVLQIRAFFNLLLLLILLFVRPGQLYAQDVEDLRQGYAEIWQGVNDLLKKFEAL